MAERLVRVEERQKAHEEKSAMAMFAVNERIDGLESTVSEVRALAGATNDGVMEIKQTLAIRAGVDADHGKQTMKLWQWLAIAGAFIGPTLAEKIFKMIGW